MIIYTEEAPLTKELAKHEQFPSRFTPGDLRPGNPYQFRPYPKMLYMARQAIDGKWATAAGEPSPLLWRDPNEWARQANYAATFTASCQRVVMDDDEYARAVDEGWRDSAHDALDFREALERAVGEAAAERAFSDRKMSEKAQAEAAKVESETFGHVAEIQETKNRKK